MTAVIEQHTVLPPDQHEKHLAPLLAMLHTNRAALVGPSGERVELPTAIYRALLDVAEALSQGLAITIAPHNTQLTTQEAADLLQVSRPTLVKLLEQGDIPFELRGRHRRVMLADIVEYQKTVAVKQRSALDEMTREAAADGSYAEVTGFVRTR